MQERGSKEKLLDELKTEREHQVNFIQRLNKFYDELNKGGYKPLDSIRQMIATWGQNLSLVEKQIKELEEMLRSKLDKT